MSNILVWSFGDCFVIRIIFESEHFPINTIPHQTRKVQRVKPSMDDDIPHVTPEIIVKYVTDLQLLGVL